MIKLGVFIDGCKGSVSEHLDMDLLVREIEKDKRVSGVFQNERLNSEQGEAFIKEKIKKNKLERVVIAGCSPRSNEATFRGACLEAGINASLVAIANIREQCAWVHQGDREGATHKALALTKMAIARCLLYQPGEDVSLEVNPRVMVVGGGIAGMNAALSMANRGFEVTLVEREGRLGGMLNRLYKIYPSYETGRKLVARTAEKVKGHSRIKLLLNTSVKKVEGRMGDYKVILENPDGEEQQESVGVVIAATGARVLEPWGLYNYDGKRVITQLELERLLERGEFKAKNVVMIQCAGARGQVKDYCSKICCLTALKNATLIKELHPNTNVVVLYQVIQTYGIKYEDDHRRARGMGIVFLRYAKDDPPRVENGTVTFYHDFLGDEVEIDADLVVLSTPLIANEDALDVARALGINADEDDFFLESNIKMKPVDASREGIYIAGTCRWPCDIDEAVGLALAASERAAIPLLGKSLQVASGIMSVASVLEDECIGCKLCEYSCPSGAIQVEDTEKGAKARVEEVLCMGCGVCVSACPERAVELKHYTDEIIRAQLKEALVE
jgi:heterodisulfide reductase subunit A